MVQSTVATSRMAPDMDPALRFGQTVPDTRENGSITRLMVKVNSGMPTEMCTKVIGKMIRQMGSEFTSMLMAPSTRVIGVTISKRATELSLGATVASTKVATKKE